MAKWLTISFRVLAIAVPVALGVGTILASKAGKSEPKEKQVAERVTPVRVVTLETLDLAPSIRGYGLVRPSATWRAVNRIEGEITWISDRVADGNIVEKGEELARIDDSAIKLSLAQVDAQIASLAVKDDTLRASIAISSQDLELSSAEAARQEELRKRGVGTPATAEQARRQELSARANLKNLENQLALNVAERDVLAAQRAILARDLEYAAIRAPFAMIIGEVQAEEGQFVTRGQTLFSADGIDRIEVAAQFPIGRMVPLRRALEATGDPSQPFALEATVRLRAPDHVIEWPARIDRVGDVIDPRTQSANVIVTVDQPFEQAEPGVRPPLRRNMFVEVELRAPPHPALALPAEAITSGKVFVVGAENRLESRDVKTAYTVGGLAVITDGLEPGAKVVVTDKAITVVGMQVKPIEDEALKARLAASTKPREAAQ